MIVRGRIGPIGFTREHRSSIYRVGCSSLLKLRCSQSPRCQTARSSTVDFAQACSLAKEGRCQESRDDPQFDRELLRVVKGLGYPSLESMLSPDMRKTAVRITKELLQEARTKAARKSATKGSPAWSNLGKDSPSQGGRPRAPSMEGVRRRAQSWLDSLCSLEENLAVAHATDSWRPSPTRIGTWPR